MNNISILFPGSRAVFCFLLSMLSCLAYAQNLPEAVFDDREWYLASKSTLLDNQLYTKEYCLKGENVESWSELITIQSFPNARSFSNLNEIKKAYVNSINKVCPNAEWSFFEESPHETLWKFEIRNCPGQPDHTNLTRTVLTKPTIHIMQYAKKQTPMPAQQERFWLDRLKAISIPAN